MGYFAKFGKRDKGVEFMDDRAKGFIADLVGRPVKVDEFAFINTKNGRCAVFTVQGIDSTFWFAPTALTEFFEEVEADGMSDAIRGVLITIEQRTSKSGNPYFGYTVTE